MATWERKRILIWGKTRPELSATYKEIVCTGGIFEDTKRFVRLYPLPLRFLDDSQTFRKYQWIEATVRKAISDSRPESFNVRCDNITPLNEVIPTANGNWDKRAEWVMQPGNIFPSLSALQAARERGEASLGLVQPSEIIDIFAEPINQVDKEEFRRKYNRIQQQKDLFEDKSKPKVKPLSPPDFRFKIEFRCADEDKTVSHKFSVLDWEVDALYFRCLNNGSQPEEAAQEVIQQLRNRLSLAKNDVHFFLGNMKLHQHIFVIVGLWYPKKKAAPKPKPVVRTLFDEFGKD